MRILLLALVFAQGGAPGRLPIESVLPRHFGFGISCFSAAGDWPERMKQQHGVAWDFFYIYLVPVDDVRARNEHLANFLRRSEKAGAIPIVSFYQLLQRGQRRGLKGPEIEVVLQAVKDKDLMREYLADVKEVLQVLAKFPQPAIFHSEPDSWAFMEWHGTRDTHDALQCPAMVKSSGLPEAAGFDDNAAGLARAILRLRDLVAPRVYMGIHAKDFRAGTRPYLPVKLIRDCGKWDILIGDGIGHGYLKRDAGWWDTFSDDRLKLYMTWFGTLTRDLGLKYIHWQTVIGAGDYALMPDYTGKERLSSYIAAGSAACTFDLRGDPEKGGRSDPAHGYADRPPEGHPAMNTPQALIDRLERYYKKPLPARPRRRRSLTPASGSPR